MNFSVKVFPIKNAGTLKANVQLTIDDIIVINDIKLIEGEYGMFLSMPTRSYLDGKKQVFRDIVYFLDKEVKEKMLDEVLNAFENHENKKRSSRK